MWGLVTSSMTLFFQGRLFADPMKVCRQLAIGVVVTAGILFIGVKAGTPIWIAGFAAGLIGGALQPYLFKDLKYR